MGDIHAALGHHLDQAAIANLIGDVPSGGEDDDGVVKVTTSEQG